MTCWGLNVKQALGSARTTTGPEVVPGVHDAVELAMGHGSHACARLANGSIKCWGENENAEVGIIENLAGEPEDGMVVPAEVPPVEVPGVAGAVALSVGANHTCAWTAPTDLWCWGQRAYGAVDRVVALTPVAPERVDPSPAGD